WAHRWHPPCARQPWSTSRDHRDKPAGNPANSSLPVRYWHRSRRRDQKLQSGSFASCPLLASRLIIQALAYRPTSSTITRLQSSVPAGATHLVTLEPSTGCFVARFRFHLIFNSANADEALHASIPPFLSLRSSIGRAVLID